MQRIHRTFLDVATSLGMSQSLIRMIERRVSGDKVLLYSGMIIILLLVYIAYSVTHPAPEEGEAPPDVGLGGAALGSAP